MDVSRIRALRGPNLWSRHTAIEAIVACAPHERALTTLPGFEARLRALFPGAAVESRRLTLAPPLARRLPPALLPWVAALPGLTTHRLTLLRKPL